MEYGMHNEEYYKKMLELQERLRKSEEERLKLEEKFNETMQKARDAEHDRLRLMRYKYHKFLEEDKIRQERNENILRALDRIESRAKMLEAKTSRFKAFRKQCESYIKRIYRSKTEQQPPFQNTSPTQLDRTYTQSNVRKKLFPDLPTTNESVEGKLAMLEQYLRDNFENFPGDITNSQKNINSTRVHIDENGHTSNNLQNKDKNTFYNQNNYEKQQYYEPDSDSKESQEIFDDYKTYPRKSEYKQNIQYPKPPTKSELLGNTIEKELERLRHKEQVKQISFLDENKDQLELKQPEKVIQNYKDLISKSEEKYGLRGESPVRNINKEIEKCDFDPKIFDNKTNTLNVEELKNITNTSNLEKPTNIEENVESESENIIKNYKNMVKHLKEEMPVAETNNSNVHVPVEYIDPENNVSEISKDDNSERTEPPTDVSLNISSHKIDKILPIEQIKSVSNIKNEDTSNHFNQNVNTNENSLDESTVKEQLHVNLEKESLEKVKQSDQDDNHNIQEQLVYEEYAQEESTEKQVNQNEESYQPEVHGNQHVYQEQSYKPDVEGVQHLYQEQTYQPEVEDQDVYKEQTYQQEVEDQHVYQEPTYPPEVEDQHVYQEQTYQPEVDQQVYKEQSYEPEQIENQVTYSENIQQPEYQQDYDVSQQNIGDQPIYEQEYNIQQTVVDGATYQEGYDQNNTNQVEYIENNISKQQIVQQQEYQEGYDMTQQNPNYQEGYDPQYYAQQQDQTGQEYNPQYAEEQEMYPEGYEQYPQEQFDQQQPDYTQEQKPFPENQYPVQQETYDTQIYSTDQGQYQEFNPSTQPEEYQQEYEQQYTQEGQVSENLYKSEQEYIKGEQNIDKQYENQEYQAQNYPEESSLQQPGNLVNEQEESNVNISESTEKSSSLHLNDSIDNKPIVEKKLPNITDMLDTDTESQSMKQDTKVSNDSDFDFSKS